MKYDRPEMPTFQFIGFQQLQNSMNRISKQKKKKFYRKIVRKKKKGKKTGKEKK